MSAHRCQPVTDGMACALTTQSADEGDTEATNQVLLNMEDSSRVICEFFAQIDSIRTNIDIINKNIEEVKKLQNKIVIDQEDEKTKHELDEKMAEIKKVSEEVRIRLKKMERIQKSQAPTSKSNAQSRIEETQLFVTQQQFCNAIKEYNSIQVHYRDRCKSRLIRQLQMAGRQKSEIELEKMLENENLAMFSGIMVETQEAKQNLADIEARHRELLKLENSIKELTEMFRDMALIVNTQGEMIDSIEYNIRKATDWVEIGKDNVVVLNSEVKKRRRVNYIKF
ncbi:unnamed protein product [Didymodactylos carnosus]|uniref:t-SNARE coiled-coil homology domain-containing protein n=1 Tax=Didymodactylos carnosus TaxID=1234261 RepID=A0A814BK68_9BILA|nr:unnamed protein product [Didymodactylos carnosus]CAF0930454.1 unnamed protein product [Didymodactylos carnosus]CAF3563288.1 unnamed protein product [Didymodactylos carnosus]CAF3708477.1 unnamed protein product [Didymodactylos carnosus]